MAEENDMGVRKEPTTNGIAELLFPKELRRLSYFVRSLPLNIFVGAAILNLESAGPQASGNTLLLGATIIVGLYLLAFVYLPRMRDAGLPLWALVFGLVPYLSNALGLLLLFRPSRHSWLGGRDEPSTQTQTIAGNTCSICGQGLVVQTDGRINESNEVVCNACAASRSATGA